jgi:CHAT domain-containing protein
MVKSDLFPRCFMAACLAIGIGGPAAAAPAAEPHGLLVEAAAPRYGGALAGLQAGDWIVSWSRPATPLIDGASGAFETPFDLWRVIFEQAPRGPVTVYGRREGEDKVWSLPPSRWWGVDTRPILADDLLEMYDAAQVAVKAGNLDRGLLLGGRAAEILQERGDDLKAAWLDRWAAGVSMQAGRWEQSDEATERGVERLMACGHFWEAVLLRRWSGLDRQMNGDWGPARQRYLRALELSHHALSTTLSEAKILIGLGAVAYGEGDLTAGEDYFLAALQLTEKIAPDSLDRAECLVDLGDLAAQRGDLVAADRWNREGLAVQEKLAPSGLDVGVTLRSLAEIASQRGFLSAAESLFRRSLAIYELNLPGQLDTAQNLGLLATLALHRGNLAEAEDDLLRALELYGDNTTERYKFSEILVTLAGIAVQRGELASAHQYLIRAVASREQVSENTGGVADALLSLGRLEALRGETTAARRHMERALAIRRRQKERSFYVAAILRELGSLEIGSASSVKTGEDRLREAVSIFRQEVPGSLAEAEAELALGRRLAARGALKPARQSFARALAIRRRLAPGSVQEAEALYRLGWTKQKLRQPREAAADLCAAVDLLDHQRLMFGGPTEAKAYFEATVAPYYEACLRALVERRQTAEAFTVLERGRARAFLSLLAERDLRPAELAPDLAAERWRLGGDYDRLQEALRRLSPERDAAEVERLQSELTALRNQQEDLARRIRQTSPRAAALHDPQPTDLPDARAALDSGTVLLSYAVGEKNTLLFIVESAGRPALGPTVRSLPIGRRALREAVERLRGAMESPWGSKDFEAEAERLYRLLLLPAEPALRSADRILICPDGPLHALPFAALRRRGKYIAEWKAIHFAPSVTVYAELRRMPVLEDPAQIAIAAFGDPTYSPGATRAAKMDVEVRSILRRGLKLDPLPSSREEATTAAGLFTGGQAFIGNQATEEQVKRIAPRSRILHFACHGLLDEQMPLNSGLALAIPEHPAEGQDNGILQAWEIFENLRLDADLVTLSACDTALGKDMGGEGVLGLTRAFQFAGARSVLSSLWSVADDSTATLMKAFYSHLRRGESKDEALRAAQLALIHAQRRGFSHPYHWAAFQLYGAWR